MSTEKLKKLLDIGRQLAETRELDPLLESAMSLALDFVGAEYGYIVLLDKDNLVFRVGQGKDGNRLKEPHEQISRTSFNEVIKSGKGKITEDAIDSFNTASVLDLKIRSVICVPLISRGKVLGAAYVENRSAGNLFEKKTWSCWNIFLLKQQSQLKTQCSTKSWRHLWMPALLSCLSRTTNFMSWQLRIL